jgi:hypothetical protein
MLVFSSPKSPEDEAAYNDWYTHKHLQDVANVEGVISATRYKIEKSVAPMPGLPSDPRSYLAIYELEAETTEGLAAMTAAMQRRLQAGQVDVSPTLDLSTASAVFAVPISPTVRAKFGS